jgi:hypothetical protein
MDSPIKDVFCETEAEHLPYFTLRYMPAVTVHELNIRAGPPLFGSQA